MTPVTGIAIEQDKLTLYLLNVDHPEGGSKAKFLLGHGFDPSDPKALADSLSLHAASYWPGSIVTTKWATKHVLTGGLVTPYNREVRILSVWQVKSDGLAWFVTARPA